MGHFMASFKKAQPRIYSVPETSEFISNRLND